MHIQSPTSAATDAPTALPTEIPTDVPTNTPTDAPTDVPTDAPTNAPTDVPTDAPTDAPTSFRSGCPDTSNPAAGRPELLGAGHLRFNYEPPINTFDYAVEWCVPPSETALIQFNLRIEDSEGVEIFSNFRSSTWNYFDAPVLGVTNGILTPGSEYTMRVRARNDAGYSSYAEYTLLLDPPARRATRRLLQVPFVPRFVIGFVWGTPPFPATHAFSGEAETAPRRCYFSNCTIPRHQWRMGNFTLSPLSRTRRQWVRGFPHSFLCLSLYPPTACFRDHL